MKLATPPAGALRRVLCALALIVPVSPALAEEFSVTSGLSAHWFNPERSGEGLVLEILSEESALLYWFTYDEDGNQRWLLDVGEIDGDQIVFPELTVTRGGQFGPNFEPDNVEYEVVGEATLSFSDCDNGEFSYTAFGQSESIPMQRLSQTMAAGCQPPQGVPGQPVREYAGQSGSWYDPTHAGEGYTLQWMSRDEAVLIWFSYDPEGNQYWMLGTGTYDEGKIEFPMLHSTQGGRFGSEFDSDDVESIEWGSLTLEIGCDGGTAQYESEISGFGSGTLELDRLTQMSRPACPWVSPSLSDLYEIDLIPVSDTTTSIQALDINDDGLIAAVHTIEGGGALALRGLDDEEWRLLQGPNPTGNPPRISPDGSKVVSGTSESTQNGTHFRTILWDVEGGWSELPNTIFDQSSFATASQDLTRIVGRGAFEGDPARYPWVWDAENGQVELPFTEEITYFVPRGVASDGEVVIGLTIRPGEGGMIGHREVAVRWTQLDGMHFIHDSLGFELGFPTACNADCSVVIGMEQAEYDPDHPHFREAWLWRDDGRMTYLGLLPGAAQDAPVAPATPIATSADGSIVVGSYPMFNPGNSPGTRGFIWTQNTGMVSVRDLLEEADLGDDEWDFMHASAVSPDGTKILIRGTFRQSQFSPTRSRVMVLTLTERL